jgi:hypothetical protein
MTVVVIEEGTGTLDLAEVGLAPKDGTCGYAFAVWHPRHGTRIRFCEMGNHSLTEHKIEYKGRIYSRTGKEQ